MANTINDDMKTEQNSLYSSKSKLLDAFYNKFRDEFSSYLQDHKNTVHLLVENSTLKRIKASEYLKNQDKNKSHFTPIPHISRKKITSEKEKEELDKLERNAVCMRKIEYSQKIRNEKLYKKYEGNIDDIILIQKNVRGFLKKKILENEKIKINNDISDISNHNAINMKHDNSYHNFSHSKKPKMKSNKSNSINNNKNNYLYSTDVNKDNKGSKVGLKKNINFSAKKIPTKSKVNDKNSNLKNISTSNNIQYSGNITDDNNYKLKSVNKENKKKNNINNNNLENNSQKNKIQNIKKINENSNHIQNDNSKGKSPSKNNNIRKNKSGTIINENQKNTTQFNKRKFNNNLTPNQTGSMNNLKKRNNNNTEINDGKKIINKKDDFKKNNTNKNNYKTNNDINYQIKPSNSIIDNKTNLDDNDVQERIITSIPKLNLQTNKDNDNTMNKYNYESNTNSPQEDSNMLLSKNSMINIDLLQKNFIGNSQNNLINQNQSPKGKENSNYNNKVNPNNINIKNNISQNKSQFTNDNKLKNNQNFNPSRKDIDMDSEKIKNSKKKSNQINVKKPINSNNKNNYSKKELIKSKEKVIDSNSDSIPDEKNEIYKNSKLRALYKKNNIDSEVKDNKINHILQSNTEKIQRAYRNHLIKKGYFGDFDKRKIIIVFLLKSVINYKIKPYVFNHLKNLFYEEEKSIDTLPDNYEEINKERIKNISQVFNHAANIINYKEKLSSIIDEEEKF